MTGAILQVESTGISEDAEDHIEEITKDETLMNSTSWEAGWDAWEKEQVRRKEVMRDVCGGTWDQTTQRKKYQKLIKGRRTLQHHLVNDENKAIYCYIPKVRNTAFHIPKDDFSYAFYIYICFSLFTKCDALAKF